MKKNSKGFTLISWRRWHYPGYGKQSSDALSFVSLPNRIFNWCIMDVLKSKYTNNVEYSYDSTNR